MFWRAPRRPMLFCSFDVAFRWQGGVVPLSPALVPREPESLRYQALLRLQLGLRCLRWPRCVQVEDRPTDDRLAARQAQRRRREQRRDRGVRERRKRHRREGFGAQEQRTRSNSWYPNADFLWWYACLQLCSS